MSRYCKHGVDPMLCGDCEETPWQPRKKPAPPMIEGIQGKVVYLSGAITGHETTFKAKFERWKRLALGDGAARVLNPAELPDGWTNAEYMEHCMLMVRRAEVVLMLPCWTTSRGAKAERAYAESLRLTVLEGGDAG